MDKNLEMTIRGATWIYLASLTVTVTGFVFWLAIARLAGPEAVGTASLVVSSAGLATSLLAAGLQLAVSRETAARGGKAAVAAVSLALAVGLVAALVGYILAEGADLGSYSIYTGVFTLLATLQLALLGVLMGLLMFRLYFLTVLTANLGKMAVGVALALLGYGALSAVLGVITAPLLVAVVSLSVLAAKALRRGIPWPDTASMRSLAVLAASNYPLMFSIQLLVFLSIYGYRLLGGSLDSTGGLYISFMILLALTSLPTSLQLASLPVGTRFGGRPQEASLRLGLVLSTPLAVALIVLAPQVLALINPELAQGSNTLRLLLLATAPLTALMATASLLNKEGQPKSLAILGLTTLSTLTLLLPPLTKSLNSSGAAAAFLAATTLNALLQTHILKLPTKPLLTAQTAQATALPLALYMPPLAALPLALVASATILLASRTAELREIHTLVKTAVSTIGGRETSGD
ncbi:hypothetical protein [Aeropyrum camini]|uniref:hypothetical protein n=1 Tax=Aeropyrum camini TaxID=229980 RepID=UPI001E4EC36F|nr:hypothetical protein [Aeropyrum camini]